MRGHGKGKKNSKYENPCWYNHCHHNRDKRRILWKQGRHKTNKSIKPKHLNSSIILSFLR